MSSRTLDSGKKKKCRFYFFMFIFISGSEPQRTRRETRGPLAPNTLKQSSNVISSFTHTHTHTHTHTQVSRSSFQPKDTNQQSLAGGIFTSGSLPGHHFQVLQAVEGGLLARHFVGRAAAVAHGDGRQRHGQQALEPACCRQKRIAFQPSTMSLVDTVVVHCCFPFEYLNVCFLRCRRRWRRTCVPAKFPPATRRSPPRHRPSTGPEKRAKM